MALNLSNVNIILSKDSNNNLVIGYNASLGSTDSTKLLTPVGGNITSSVQAADIATLTTEYTTLLALINTTNGVS